MKYGFWINKSKSYDRGAIQSYKNLIKNSNPALMPTD